MAGRMPSPDELEENVYSMGDVSSDYFAVIEQQEELRRFVDDWRSDARGELEQLDSSFSTANARDVGDLNEDPILISIKPHDGASILDLIKTDNVPLNKIMIVLAHDCLQIVHMRQQAVKTIYPRLAVFGLRTSSEEAPVEGQLQKIFANSLNFFQGFAQFVVELRAVLSNLVQQLEALYPEEAPRGNSRNSPSFSNVHFKSVLLSMAEGLSVLVTLDELMAQNSMIGHAFVLFIRMLQSARSNPGDFAMEPEQVESLNSEVAQVENFLLGGLFQRCIQEDFYGHPDMQKLKMNQRCLDEVSFCIRTAISQTLARFDSPRERPDDRENAVGLLAVWVWHSWMTGESKNVDSKLVKVTLEVHRHAPVLHLFCNVRLVPLKFLTSHLPSWILSAVIIKNVQKESDSVTSGYLTLLDEKMKSQFQSLKMDWANWLVSFDSTVSLTVQRLAVHAMLGTRFKQLAQGVFLANRMRHLLRATIDIHEYLEVPINKEQLRSLCHIAEMLKAVEGMFHRRSSETAMGIGLMLQLAQSQISRRLLHIKDQLQADIHKISKSSTVLILARTFTRSGKDPESKLMDMMAAVNLAIKMVQGCASMQRSVILRLALDILSSGQGRVSDDALAEMADLCAVIDLVGNIYEVVKAVTDCSFLYWSKATMPTCFKMLYGQTGEARHLQLIIDAFKDPIKLLQSGLAEQQMIKSYECEIEDAIHRELVVPLCREIETDLRLHVHSAQLAGLNPTKTGVRDLPWFLLHLKPLKLASKRIHIKSRVERYLMAAFYDHTAVALHDWKTYGEMRQLAELKYRLELDDIHLPGQILEQGVDVLEIMRNIHLFVACYWYNLNTQVFIEKASNAYNRKYLNTVNAKHVANSIRYHGTGIISTTINFAYQFLAQKFVVFSQFLYDDHIKSRLIKERHFYKETRLKGSTDYPLGRAQKLNKEIRKLGLTEDGLSSLDQFRQLISEIGNALGFVRMVRLGGVHYCSSASGFVHNVGDNKTFEWASRNAGMSDGGICAAKILDQAFESQKMSVDRMDYFNVLTTVFSPELQSTDNLHLKDFFLIVPALTVNAVESMLHAKDKLSRRGRDGLNGMFTDDGFALGLAYVLKVLGQDKTFDSLHWFQSVRHHFAAENARVAEGLDMNSIGSGMNGLQIWSQKVASMSEEEAQNLQVVMKRSSSYLAELDLMYFTFSGARVFF